jgi:hypothetical protein
MHECVCVSVQSLCSAWQQWSWTTCFCSAVVAETNLPSACMLSAMVLLPAELAQWLAAVELDYLLMH